MGQGWADKKASQHQFRIPNHGPEPLLQVTTVATLLQQEHARAVRIVKRAKALQFHGLRDTDTNEFLEGYEAACVDILSALTNGRA